MERMKCEIHIDGMDQEHVSKFKYLGYVLNESGTDETVLKEGGKCEEG